MVQPKILTDMEAFDTQYKFKWFEHYKASIKFDGRLSCSGAFDTYEQTRIKNIDGFKDIKTPNGSSLTEKLNASLQGEAGEKVKSAIAGTLAASAAETKATRDEFTKEVTDLNKLLSEPKPRFHPGEIGRHLLDFKSKAVESVKSQHTKAKAELTALLDNPDFQQNLKDSNLGYTDGNLSTALKDEMLAAMDKNNKEELEKLEKTINEDANKLFQAARDNYHRLSYLGYKKNAHKTMDKIISDNMTATGNVEDDAVQLIVNGGKGGDITLKNVDPKTFAKYDTINHSYLAAYLDRTIEKTDNGFRMSLNSRWNSEATILEDLTSFCETIKACGKDKITISINNEDEETGLEHARLAYEAAINAGFDPKKVTINFGSKVVMSYDDKGVMNKDSDLFKEHGSRLSHIKGKAAKIEKEVKKFIEGEENGGTKVKEALKDMRDKAAAEALAGANPASTNNPVS